MTTDDFTPLLSPYLDGELDAADTARLEAHLARCAECSAALADLRAIVAAAPRYPGRAPSPAVWAAIEARLDEATVVRIGAATRRFGWPALLAASLATAVVGGGAGWILSRRTPPDTMGTVALRPSPPAGQRDSTHAAAPQSSTPVVRAPDGAAPARLAGSAAVAEQRYAAAVMDLERVLDAGRGRLDTATVRTVEESLRKIDRAIAEARAAVQRDPANAYLSRQIAANMRRKLNLLRTATNAIAARS